MEYLSMIVLYYRSHTGTRLFFNCNKIMKYRRQMTQRVKHLHSIISNGDGLLISFIIVYIILSYFTGI